MSSPATTPSNVFLPDPLLVAPSVILCSEVLARHLHNLVAVNSQIVLYVADLWPRVVQDYQNTELAALDELALRANSAAEATNTAESDLGAILGAARHFRKDAARNVALHPHHAQHSKSVAEALGVVGVFRGENKAFLAVQEALMVSEWLFKLSHLNHAMLAQCPSTADSPRTDGLVALGSRVSPTPSLAAAQQIVTAYTTKLLTAVAQGKQDGLVDGLALDDRARYEQYYRTISEASASALACDASIKSIICVYFQPMDRLISSLPAHHTAHHTRARRAAKLIHAFTIASHVDTITGHSSDQADFFEGWIYAVAQVKQLFDWSSCDCEFLGSPRAFDREVERSARLRYAENGWAFLRETLGV
ncbi:hypothetical protein MKEN_00959000 [Mycena kentingensis (nom. inval.)]|nr:hypothetical protein MKEN_00959000 [Mycena kentingensis (nom. inval.)]